MRKFHFKIRFRVNLAAHDHAHTAVFIHLIDPPNPVQSLVFRNDTPEGLPWSWAFSTPHRVAAVTVDILSDKHTKGGRPAVWAEAQCAEYHRLRRVRADDEGQIRYHEIFGADDTSPL